MDSRAPLSLLFALLLILCAACGTSSPGNGDAAAGPTASDSSRPSTTRAPTGSSSTAAPATSRTTVADQDQEAERLLESYRGAIDAYARMVADPPNPDDTGIADWTADPLLTEFRNTAATWKGFGQASRYPDNSVQSIELITSEVTGGQAVIEVCSVDDSVLYEPATGRILNDDVATSRIRAQLSLDGDRWKVTHRERLERWEGVGGCAA